MISAKVLVKHFEKFALQNAPSILTGIGVVGAATTAVLAGKASFKASDRLGQDSERRQLMNEQDRDLKDSLKLVWTCYIPPAGALVGTVSAIVCANRVSAGRLAAMATAYSLSEGRISEYREKVIEKFNGNKEHQIRDEIAQDHVRANPPNDKQIIITGNGDVLCHDLQTGRYFRSNMEKLRSIQNNLNAAVVEVGFASLNDLYVNLGLDPTPYSDQLGWTTSKMLDIHFSAVLTEDSQPCISIDYTYEPLHHADLKAPRGCDEDPQF